MAGRDVERGYQLYQILQRRHLFEKPIELLIKVRCQDGRLKEIWVPKSEVVAMEIGRKMWREFSKTKVGERGVDVYIGKRRSFSAANQQFKDDGKVLIANNALQNEAGEKPLEKASIKKLTINVSRVGSISSESTRKIKSRTHTNTKQNINNSSKFSSTIQAKTFARLSSRQNLRASNCSSKISILNKRSSDSLLPHQIMSRSKSLDESKKSESSNGNSQISIKGTHTLTDGQKPEDCKMPKLEHFNCRNPQTQCPANQVCPSCVSFFPTKGEDAHHGFQTSPLVLGYQTPLPTYCTKCCCHHHPREDTKTGKSSHPSAVMETVAMERRVSIRQTESAFRLKEILVRKFAGFVHLILGSETSNKKIFKNSFNPKVLLEICTVLRNLTHDDCRVVLVSGSGSIFSSGIDITYLLDSELDRKTAAKNMVEALRDFVNVLISFPKPIVVAVNGPATGLGTAMLPLCDIVYASDKASFSCPYTSFAQTSEACSSYTFPKVMGHAMANEMLLRGRKITALEAHQIGLVTQVFWPENLMGEVIPRVQNLVQHPTKAVECSKALIRNHKKAKLEMVNESECRMLSERWQSSECQKAMRLFIEDQTNSL